MLGFVKRVGAKVVGYTFQSEDVSVAPKPDEFTLIGRKVIVYT